MTLGRNYVYFLPDWVARCYYSVLLTFSFSFKLFEFAIRWDGIPSYLEDLNGDGYVRVLATGVLNPDDTDGEFLIF
jgi:hypothetical protein